MKTRPAKWAVPAAAALLALGAALPARPGLRAGENAAPTGGAVPAEAAVATDRGLAGAIRDLVPAYVFVGQASGVAISADGYVLTNDHVAGSAQVWKVRQPSGRVWVADLVGTDPVGDIALLKMRGAQGIPFVELGDSDALAVGQTVVAIGNPFMLGMADDAPTVTTGVVSALNRHHGNYTDAVQTDAPINPGNSGGPLLTLDGRLIGINGQIATRFGTRSNTGIGYAISVNQIKKFLPALKAAGGGRVRHGAINGLSMRAFSPGEAGGEDRAMVLTVMTGSTADRAGLLPGDEIAAVDGRPVANHSRFAGILGTYPAGSEVKLTVSRAGAREEVTVCLDPRPIPGQVDFGWTFERTAAGRIEQQGGLVIRGVREGGPAERAGLKAGDVLTEFNWMRLDTPRAVMAVLRAGYEPGMAVGGRVLRRPAGEAGAVPEPVGFEIVPGKGVRADLGMRFQHSREACGLVVMEVERAGPAARAGLRPGDVVTEFDGRDLADPDEIFALLQELVPGQTLKGKLLREPAGGAGKTGPTTVEFTLKVTAGR
jgi:serine protease Do